MGNLSLSLAKGKPYRVFSQGKTSLSLTGVRCFPPVKNSERFTLGKEDKSFPLLKNRGFPWLKTL
jgi:hypothetical protein